MTPECEICSRPARTQVYISEVALTTCYTCRCDVVVAQEPTQNNYHAKTYASVALLYVGSTITGIGASMGGGLVCCVGTLFCLMGVLVAPYDSIHDRKP